jgi:superkiller protein 3
LVQALIDVLPGSPYYPLLSTLPEPDATNPTATTTFWIQTAIHDSFPILEEVVSIVEAEEQARFAKEFSARRTRLGAPKPTIIRRELDREICGSSMVCVFELRRGP